jgi:transcriptional regulator with XRE-family HTH domain
MNITSKLFGERLEEFRKKEDLKQEDVADIIGTNYSKVGRIERNVNDAEMGYMELHRLIKHFDLSPDALILHCEFARKKKSSGLATKIMQLLEEIKNEYEDEKRDT